MKSQTTSSSDSKCRNEAIQWILNGISCYNNHCYYCCYTFFQIIVMTSEPNLEEIIII